MAGVTFTISRYESFMENKKEYFASKNIKKKKKKKKKKFSLIKILLVLIKNRRHWKNPNIHRISKGKKVNKLWQKLFSQH